MEGPASYGWVESVLGPPPERAPDRVEDSNTTRVNVKVDWDEIQRQREISEGRRRDRMARKGFSGGVAGKEEKRRLETKREEDAQRDKLYNWERETKPKVKLPPLVDVDKQKGERWRHQTLIGFTQVDNEINRNLNSREIDVLLKKETAHRTEITSIEKSESSVIQRMAYIRTLASSTECRFHREQNPGLVTDAEVFYHFLSLKTSRVIEMLEKNEVSGRTGIVAEEQNETTKLSLRLLTLQGIVCEGKVPSSSPIYAEEQQRVHRNIVYKEEEKEFQQCIISSVQIHKHAAKGREAIRLERDLAASTALASEERAQRSVVVAEESCGQDKLWMSWDLYTKNTTQALLWRVLKSEASARVDIEAQETDSFEQIQIDSPAIAHLNKLLRAMTLTELLEHSEHGCRRSSLTEAKLEFDIIERKYSQYSSWRRILIDEALRRDLAVQEEAVEFTKLRILSADSYASAERDEKTELEDIWGVLSEIPSDNHCESLPEKEADTEQKIQEEEEPEVPQEELPQETNTASWERFSTAANAAAPFYTIDDGDDAVEERPDPWSKLA